MILTRYITDNGRGTWDEGKEKLPSHLIDQVNKARRWCPHIPELKNLEDCEFWFTPLGDQKYRQTLLPLHQQYLSEIHRKVKRLSSLSQDQIAYYDDYQYVIKK